MATHTYWRLNLGHSAALDGYLNIAEIQMRGAVSGPDLLTGGTVTASSELADLAAYACDDNPATWWSSNFSGSGHWWRYQFAAPVDIEEVTLQAVGIAPNRMPMWFSLEWSDDGTTWATKARIVQQNGWTGGEQRAFATPNGLEWFGQTVTGGTSVNTPIANNLCLTSFVLAEPADVTKLSGYAVLANGTVQIRGMIYAADGAEYDPEFDPGVIFPGTLMGTTNAITGIGPHWYDLVFPSPVSLPAGSYWLGVMADQTMNAAGHAASGRSIRVARSYGLGAPSPFGVSGFVDTNQRPFYATYTEGAAPAVTGAGAGSLADLTSAAAGSFLAPIAGSAASTLAALSSSASGSALRAGFRQSVGLLGTMRRVFSLNATWVPR